MSLLKLRQMERRRRRGLSLIEVLATAALVGIGVAGMMMAVGSGTRVNAEALKISQASHLVHEIREWTLKLPFRDEDAGDKDNPPGPDGSDPQSFVDDLDDFLGNDGSVSYSPPRDGTGTAISGMDDWTQTITPTWRDVNELTRTVDAGASDVIYMEVTVLFGDRPILTSGWFVMKK
ncbi:MAG: type IV pilus modification PilV family protein [Planctomycetota bacterium]|jgi:prepilin-type N-terminal cleavage/methylation domain-containing protein